METKNSYAVDVVSVQEQVVENCGEGNSLVITLLRILWKGLVNFLTFNRFDSW